jgi:N-acetylglucosaminyl-diphospho-decaprenol L-rhamnosyltransferase
MPLSVDVVIPTYGSWPVTARCLRSLERQTAEHRVIVVDDASPDDTVARIRAEFPAVRLIALEQNVGYGSACNIGIRDGNGEVVLLLNNDVEAEPEMLERCVLAFEESPRVGSVSPLLLRPDGTVDAIGISADATLAGFVRFAGDPLERVDAARSVLLGPYGAAGAYRRSALDAVGLLDERIFMYGEELDLALRLRAAGWDAVDAVEARGTHLGGATIGRGSKRQREHAGFGRGYLLRTYGVLRGRHALRACAVELLVCVGDLVRRHDIAATRGRLRGWRAGAQAPPRPRPMAGIDPDIGVVRSILMRL